jgi:hypothetical protein
MSIYPSPRFNHGVLNSTFNSSDYIQTNAGGSSLTIAQTDAKYLQISGVTNSSAQTTFQNTVDFKSLLTVDDIKVNTLATFNNVSVTGLLSGNVSGANISSSVLATVKDLTATGLISGNVSGANISSSVLATVKDLTATGLISGNVSGANITSSTLATVKDLTATGLISGNISGQNITSSSLGTFKNLSVSGLLKSTQTSDTLTADLFRSDQLYSFTNGMVYSIISDATAVNSVSFINIPTTTNQTYIFTFILQPTTANSPYYIRPNTNTVNVNGVSIPLYGLQNASLAGNYTYLVQQISIIYNLYATDPQFIALTSVSSY